MAKVFTYTKYPVAVDALTQEVTSDSAITVALDYITLFGETLNVFFKADLSDGEVVELNAVVAAHTGEPLPGSETKTTIVTAQAGTYAPAPTNYTVGIATPMVDGVNNLITRGTVLTDEGSFRDDFVGESLFKLLSGTYSFSSGSNQVVTKDGDVAELTALYPYIKLSTDPDTAFTQGSISTIGDIALMGLYQGSSGEGTAVASNWAPMVDGAAAAITVASSYLNVSSTGASACSAHVCKDLDYLPIKMSFKILMTARRPGQETKIGLLGKDDTSICAVMVLNGTDPSVATFRSASGPNPNDIQETTFTLPLAKTTSAFHAYTVELVSGQASLLVDGITAVVHSDHVPNNYDTLTLHIGMTDTGTSGAATTLRADWVGVKNLDQVDVANSFATVPLSVALASPKALDNKPFVSTTARPIGTYTYLSSFGDNVANQSAVAGGSEVAFSHAIGDPTTSAKYFDINAITNETHIHTAVIQWVGSALDVINCQFVPQVTSYTGGSNTMFAVSGGVIVMAPGNGNITVDLASAKFVEMTVNEYGIMPAGYWDATYNASTHLFESPTFNPYGTGRYNLFAVEVPLFAFIPAFTVLGSGLYEIKSNDESRLGHNMRIKLTANTMGADHAWMFTCAVYLYRKRTV